MAYQLCMRDEYGQGSILLSDDNLDTVITKLKQELNSINVDNALTIDAKKQNWESYMVVIAAQNDDVDDEDDEETYIYAGKDGRGVDQVFDNSNNLIKLDEIADEVSLRIFLGVLDGEDWHAAVPSRTVRGEEDVIDSLTHPALQGKTVYYIKPI